MGGYRRKELPSSSRVKAKGGKHRDASRGRRPEQGARWRLEEDESRSGRSEAGNRHHHSHPWEFLICLCGEVGSWRMYARLFLVQSDALAVCPRLPHMVEKAIFSEMFGPL